MKTLITAVAVAMIAATSAIAHEPSAGLKTLATTGWADDYAAEVGGLAFDKTGGMPGAFSYALPVDLTEARALLAKDEFLAPHYSVSPNGDVTVMVAPHLLVGGKVMKGKGPSDHFIVISGDSAERFDYSVDVEGGM